MNFQIRLFATLKDRAGQGQIQVSVPAPATVEALLRETAEQFPQLASALPTVLVSVNKAYAGKETPLQSGDEVALFPPVSGGAEAPHPTFFAITHEEMDLNAIRASIGGPDIGAVVTFSGSVRGETEREGLPPETLYLEYEAYEEMATVKMAQVAREIWQQWPLVKGVAIVQRIGKLDIGEITTIVACASAHRDQGVFEAARYGIDRLKQIVPVWKKEVGRDNSLWVEGDYRPTEADNA
ncbi:MAG: molybdenum cofactor biosynthesis protein MoaE [Candidatus Promineifilaceae bacterium]